MSDGAGLPPWRCAQCGQTHDTLPAATLPAPHNWLVSDEAERAAAFELTADTCVWKDEDHYVRSVLEIPFTDREGSLDFGVWTTLSPENFALYAASLERDDAVDLTPMFGWFANRLPGYPDTLNLKTMVHPRADGLRPWLELEPTDHPLAVAQREGIPFTDAVAYLHAHMGL